MPTSPRPLRIALVAALTAAAGCPAEEPVPPVGEGLFAAGCPEPARAGARLLTMARERPDGPDALAEPGDAMLFNEVAAFVIQAPSNPRTYYHYGGIVVDAVPVSGCAPAAPDSFGELGFVLGELDITAFDQSTLRMFRGDTIEVVSDGSDGGPAIVDVHGEDDTFWLVEMTLLKEAYLADRPKAPSAPYGLDLTLRYTLAPGDEVLQMEWILRGAEGGGEFVTGALVFPSDTTQKSQFGLGSISFGGFHLATKLGWLALSTPHANFAFSMPAANMGMTEVAGVQAVLDVAQALTPLEVSPGVTERSPYLLAISSPQRFPSAALARHDAEPAPGEAGVPLRVEGRVVDPEGAPVPGATVWIEQQDEDGNWRSLDRLLAGPDGSYVSDATVFQSAPWSLRAEAEGRDPSARTEAAGDLTVGSHGAVRVEVRDAGGGALPARLDCERQDGLRVLRYATPLDGELPMPPGNWHIWVSRGYEYDIAEVDVVVPPNGVGSVETTLTAVMDTTGWVSIDSHVHAGPSADSDTPAIDRMRTAAAGGLDVIIQTDHEIIADLSWAVGAAGLEPFLGWISGQEVTPPLPEHTNAWPFPTRDTVRGDPIRWMGHNYPAIWAEQRARGAQVVQINHARVNGECGILCLIDWDRMSEPSFPSPELLGLPPGEPFWSWDFDAFEVMNDARNPFLDPANPRRTGAFEDWLSFHNLGQRTTGVAVTDVHGLELPGSPRTWLAVADDNPSTVPDEAISAAVLGGHAQFSAGAFVRATIAGGGPGDDVSPGAGELVLDLLVQAHPEVDVTHAVVLANCDEVAEVLASDPHGNPKIDTTIALDLNEDAHVVIVVMGSEPMPRGMLSYPAADVPRAVTNPIFVDVDGDGSFTAPGPKTCSWTRQLGPP